MYMEKTNEYGIPELYALQVSTLGQVEKDDVRCYGRREFAQRRLASKEFSGVFSFKFPQKTDAIQEIHDAALPKSTFCLCSCLTGSDAATMRRHLW